MCGTLQVCVLIIFKKYFLKLSEFIKIRKVLIGELYFIKKKQWPCVKFTLVFQIRYTGVPYKTHWCLDKNTLVFHTKHTGELLKTHWCFSQNTLVNFIKFYCIEYQIDIIDAILC